MFILVIILFLKIKWILIYFNFDIIHYVLFWVMTNIFQIPRKFHSWLFVGFF